MGASGSQPPGQGPIDGVDGVLPSPSPASFNAPPEAHVTAVEQQVLDLLLKRFEGRAPAYLILQLVRSSDLIKFGRDDPKRIREWADAAAKLIEDVLKWRAEFGIDELLDAKLDKHDEFLSMWPDVVNGTDAYGRPVHWQRLGIIQPEAIMGNFSEREIIRHHSQSTELCRDECMRFAKRNGHVFVGQIEVLDLTGFGMHHFSPRFFRLIKAVISVDLTKYDGMMQGMAVLNVPWLFARMWNMLAPLLDESTKAKIFLCDARESKAKLHELGVNPADAPAGFVIGHTA